MHSARKGKRCRRKLHPCRGHVDVRFRPVRSSLLAKQEDARTSLRLGKRTALGTTPKIFVHPDCPEPSKRP
ncbi:unnamed protein product, partial [Ascophyllum nodosum]